MYFCRVFEIIIYNYFIYMLKKILSISGKPGLYKLVSTSKTITLVESLIDGKRLPIYPQEKIVSLGEIAIYTSEEEVPLKDVFVKIKEMEEGGKISDDKKSSNADLFAYFETVLPTFDKEKVYASDIKKIVNWYNLLMENKIDFETEENKTGAEEGVSQEKETTTEEEKETDATEK